MSNVVLPDLPDVDWSNPDVQTLLDVFGLKYKQKCKEATELRKINIKQGKRIAEQDERIAEQDERIAKLEVTCRFSEVLYILRQEDLKIILHEVRI